jgi:acetoin utilization deacetylase AcuC-like enzyme
MTLAIISHPDCLKHDAGPWHPERPQRLTAIQDQLIASRVNDLCHHYEAPLATVGQLARVHDEDYVQSILNIDASENAVAIDPDTIFMRHTRAAALRAAGAAVLAVDLVMEGKEQVVFCNVRPPGHHARRAQAMGFCFFNNIAVGAAHALQQHGVERLAIVDFDIHHGNGTDEMFLREPRVLFCSTYQSGIYASSLVQTSDEQHINVALSTAPSGEELRAVYRGRFRDTLESFKPQLLMVSAGFDGHVEDDLSSGRYTEEDYAAISAEIRAVADAHANGRVISVLEGGYALQALGRSVVAHLKALI